MTDIHLCAELCRMSYEEELPDGFLEVSDMRFGIRVSEGVTYIVFRGSANLMNWRRNFRVFPAKSSRGHIAHRGFMGGFRELSKFLKVPPGPVVFTGHSFGAALALLFAEKYGAPCVTFGCPRVYFRFGEVPTVVHHRYACDDDPVPMVPRFLYRHLEEAHVLTDTDGRNIDWQDHGIEVYMERL